MAKGIMPLPKPGAVFACISFSIKLASRINPEFPGHHTLNPSTRTGVDSLCRKLITCALARQDYASARSTFSKMSETGRDTPKTRYLMYKIALHEGETEFGKCYDAHLLIGRCTK